MRRPRIPAAALAVLVPVFVAAPALAQSLADVARVEAARREALRAAGAAPTHVYTTTEVLAPGNRKTLGGQAVTAAASGGQTAAKAQTLPPVVKPVAPKSAPTKALSPRPWGRVAFFTNASRLTSSTGTSVTTNELITSVTYTLPTQEGNGVEYGLDVRHSAYSGVGRPQRLSIYDGYVGARFAGGHLVARGGHMWLNDLGALGAIAGGLVEFRQLQSTSTTNRIRAGAFYGLEPLTYQTGYAPAIRKRGAYVAIDGNAARRHVVGYVEVNNASLNERGVLTITNFVPVRRQFFLYQAAEFDVRRPAGEGRNGLAYFIANARYSPVARLELQATVNRGRSIDARGLSDDVLNGRPVSQQAVDGLLYESTGGRVTVEVVKRVRAYAGYSRDKTNRDDKATGRWLVGGYASNMFGSGLDFTVSDSLIDRPTGRYHSTYFSLGRQFGRRVYVTGEYSTSLSVVRLSQSDGIAVELRPHTTRYGGSANLYLGRYFSLLSTVERTVDEDVQDLRILSGITIRLR